jgi:thiamine transport system permease protein
LAICGLLTVFAGKFAGVSYGAPPLRRYLIRFDGRNAAARLGDGLAIAMGLAILLPPLAAMVFAGLVGLSASPGIFMATATSLGLGAAAALTGLAIGWPLAQLAARSARANRAFSVASLAALIMPPAVLATGWFILLSRYSDVTGLAPVLVIAMNALMALPFVYGTLAPALRQAAAANDRLCAGWGSPAARFRIIDLPTLRKPLGLALSWRPSFARRSHRHHAFRHPGRHHSAIAHLPADGQLPDGSGGRQRPYPGALRARADNTGRKMERAG